MEPIEKLEYLSERHEFLLYSGLIIAVISSAYVIFLANIVSCIYTPIPTSTIVFVNLIVFGITLFFCWVCSPQKNYLSRSPYRFSIKVNNPKWSLVWLIFVTAILILDVSMMIYLFGGAQKSIFGSILITICSLIVVITSNIPIRITFALSCLILLGLTSTPNFYFEVLVLEKYYNFFDFRVDSNFVITVSNFIVIILFIGITFILSWKSKIIFDGSKLIQSKTNPAAFSLEQLTPSKLIVNTRIQFSIAERSRAKLIILNSNDKIIDKPFNRMFEIGDYEFEYSAQTLSKGDYLCKLKTKKCEIEQKFTVS